MGLGFEFARAADAAVASALRNPLGYLRIEEDFRRVTMKRAGVELFIVGLACWKMESTPIPMSRGIMTDAVRAASEYALIHFGLMRLEALVFAWNPASMRVLEKSDFVREGVLRKSVLKDGEFVDQALYALVR